MVAARAHLVMLVIMDDDVDVVHVEYCAVTHTAVRIYQHMCTYEYVMYA